MELWPNLIRAARRQGARIAVVNGRLSEKSYRGYRRIRPLLQRILSRIDLIAVQNEQYAERFRDLGARPDTICVTGSIKFDGAQTDRCNPATQRLRSLWEIPESSFVFLAGSTQTPEELMALSVFRRYMYQQKDARLILVPRHPERFDEVAALLDQSGLAWQRRSQLDAVTATTAAHDISGGRDPSTARILLVDVVGELGAWWGLASAGFVGGSMGRRGGQNMIEPAGYGVAVSFGPNTWNFRDIVGMLLNRQAAVVVQNESDLEAFVRRCIESPQFRQDLGARAQKLVVEQQGATHRTVAELAAADPPPKHEQIGPVRPCSLTGSPACPATATVAETGAWHL